MPISTLSRRRRLQAAIVLSAVVGIFAAVINSGLIGGFPPKIRANNLQIAAATTYVDVDPPAGTPSLAHGSGTPPRDVQTYVKRAELLGRIMVSAPVLERVARGCGISPRLLSGLGRITANVPSELTQPGSEQRASDIEASLAPYQLEVEARPLVPIIDVYAEAPSIEAAQCLANVAPVALTGYLHSLAQQEGSTATLVELRPLGPARGAIVNGGATLTIAILTFLTFFGLAFAAIAGAGRVRKGVRSGVADRETKPLERPAAMWMPQGSASSGDCWPHTTRALPWMLAVFIAVLWLIPFNDIQLNVSAPVELRFDRLVLPLVAIVWLMACVAGGRAAPRLRMTWIHAAIGALLACAFLSVVTDARYLNQTLEFTLSLKKLPLIVAYVSLFVIVASGVRRGEVRSFMSYTLGLAVLVGIGMIWEYHTSHNLFWDLANKLPGFSVTDVNGGTVDNVGRRLVRGPAEVPLEAVAMLTMALPIALVRILQAARWRQRLMYCFAVCVLVAAMFATYRKSALVAPLSVILTLAYFRRRELLKLAPLGLVLLVVVSSISPGAIGSTIREFTRSDAAAVPTVSDRTSDYDAVRPDVWTHLALGRGWGSYDHNTYRVLDSEILTRTIESGVLGLVAFLLVPISVVATGRKTIASRDPSAAPVALIGASVAVAFLVLSALFDELSFPHATYIFLYIAGLQTVVVRRHGRDAPAPAPAPASFELDWYELAPDSAEAPPVPGR